MRHIAIDQVENKPSRCHEDVLLLVERHCRVAVIGAGAAGLVAARELRKEGHEVVVFEQQEQLGGTWLYTDQVESDLLGQDAKRRRVHSSMYQGLTTNLPRQIMGYSDFPFSPSNMAGHSIDNRHFPCSEEVLRYLQAFAEHHHLQQLIRFSTHVLQAVPVRATAAAGSADVPGLHVAVPTSQQHGQQQQQPSVQDSSAALPWQRWQVTWQEHPPQATAGNCAGHIAGSDAAETPAAAAAAGVSATATPPHTELFDAVLVCNGHYTEPRLPDIPGASDFPGVLMHSHSYRCPRRFRGQHVAVIGASYSGLDIARLVAQQAAQVYVCAREWQNDKDLGAAAVRGCSNTQRRGMISRLTAAGGAEFAVGESVQQLDAVICCTGYNYHFPFLDLQALGLSTQQQHVSPLYQHMFPPAFAPGLCFIGLPWLVVPFPLFELQAKLCARLLSDRCSLPSADAMTAAVQRSFVQLQAEGLRPEHSHRLDYHQTRYHAWLAAQCGPDVSLLPNWRTAALHGFWLLRRLYLVAARIWHRPAGQPQGPKRV